jgi:CelD/BcsL family acetyltransferase involved in cellulose biosynthesis
LTGGGTAGREAIAAIQEKRLSFQLASVLTRIDKRFESFFADYCGRRRDDVEPVVSRLAVGEQAVAREIGFVHKGYYVSHLGTFDAAFGGFAPGTMQMDETIAACMERGLDTFDLLAPADDYKLDFADGVVSVRDYTMALSAKGALFGKVVIETGLPMLLRLRNQAQKYSK